MATLYRAMKRDPLDGFPLLNPSARGLGIRPGIDIPVDDYGLVEPGAGGMSVAPGSPTNLPLHRRPAEYGGEGDDPVWSIEEDELGRLLSYVPDDRNPDRH